ncbi:hypothetical protein AB5I41_04280 [Sphingomonas sp. MMS24-JH45]
MKGGDHHVNRLKPRPPRAARPWVAPAKDDGNAAVGLTVTALFAVTAANARTPAEKGDGKAVAPYFGSIAASKARMAAAPAAPFRNVALRPARPAGARARDVQGMAQNRGSLGTRGWMRRRWSAARCTIVQAPQPIEMRDEPAGTRVLSARGAGRRRADRGMRRRLVPLRRGEGQAGYVEQRDLSGGIEQGERLP